MVQTKCISHYFSNYIKFGDERSIVAETTRNICKVLALCLISLNLTLNLKRNVATLTFNYAQHNAMIAIFACRKESKQHQLPFPFLSCTYQKTTFVRSFQDGQTKRTSYRT